ERNQFNKKTFDLILNQRSTSLNSVQQVQTGQIMSINNFSQSPNHDCEECKELETGIKNCTEKLIQFTKSPVDLPSWITDNSKSLSTESIQGHLLLKIGETLSANFNKSLIETIIEYNWTPI